MYLYKTESK